MTSLGWRLAVHDLIMSRALKIDAGYSAMLACNGYAHVDAQDDVTRKAFDVDETYLKDLAAHGYSHLAVRQPVTFKARGIR